MTELDNSGKEILPPGPLIEATDFTDFRMKTDLYTRLFDLDVFSRGSLLTIKSAIQTAWISVH